MRDRDLVAPSLEERQRTASPVPPVAENEAQKHPVGPLFGAALRHVRAGFPPKPPAPPQNPKQPDVQGQVEKDDQVRPSGAMIGAAQVIAVEHPGLGFGRRPGEPVGLVARTLGPARGPVYLVDMDHRKSEPVAEPAGGRALARPSPAQHHDPFHTAFLSLSARSVRSQENPPSSSGARPKWP